MRSLDITSDLNKDGEIPLVIRMEQTGNDVPSRIPRSRCIPRVLLLGSNQETNSYIRDICTEAMLSVDITTDLHSFDEMIDLRMSSGSGYVCIVISAEHIHEMMADDDTTRLSTFLQRSDGVPAIGYTTAGKSMPKDRGLMRRFPTFSWLRDLASGRNMWRVEARLRVKSEIERAVDKRIQVIAERTEGSRCRPRTSRGTTRHIYIRSSRLSSEATEVERFTSSSGKPFYLP